MKNCVLFIFLFVVSLSGWSQDLEEMADVSNKDISQEDSTWTLPYLFTKCKNESNLNSKRFIIPTSGDFFYIELFEELVSSTFSVGKYQVVVGTYTSQSTFIADIWVEIYDGGEDLIIIPFCILDEISNIKILEEEYSKIFKYIYRDVEQ